MTKETSIIMSGRHPRLVLDGLKTMTRRTAGLNKINENPDDWSYAENIGGFFSNWWRFQNYNGFAPIIKCPYGQVGDRLYCRETFSTYPTHYKADGYIL